VIGTYVKAAAPLIPGASKLPWVAGGGGSEMPRLSRVREDVPLDPQHVAAYAKVCGFGVRNELPVTYPHMLAFPLHMELMTDGKFPFGAIGLVHLRNQITQHRPLSLGERLTVYARTGELEPHPKGRTFDILTEVRADDEVVWEETSTMLSRGRGSEEKRSRAKRAEPPAATVEWKLPGNLGRRYASVSGDSNPIHLHAITARLFGFPRAIAHGMWTKARCLAALERDLPASYTVGVEFLKPILLPGTVGFGSDGDDFAVRSGDTIHLQGKVTR
jgi:acyl dehydratase